jgi:hypothetical protein
MTIAEMIAELEAAISVLSKPSPETVFLVLPEDAEQYSYRRGVRDGYQLVVKALKEIGGFR